MKKIVLIGGGFGGLYFAKNITSSDYEITLIDRRNHHLFQPLLYQVATGGLSPGDIAYPIRSILAKNKSTRVVQDEVISFEKDAVITKKDRYPFDYLVVAAGAENFYFGNDSWEKVAPGLKTIEDALAMRAEILAPLEKAEIESNPEKQKEFQTIAVIGGGPTGVELCGAIAELTRATLKGSFRKIKSEETRILLIEAGNRVLSTYTDSLSQKGKESLESLGVEVHLQTKVISMKPGELLVEKDGVQEVIKTGAILWGAGVKANPLGTKLKETFNAELDRAGRAMVNHYLQLKNQENVFVLGDLAHYQTQNGIQVPGTAPVAIQQGNYLASYFNALAKGKNPNEFHYKDKGSLAVIGRNKAIALVGDRAFSGFPAWALWAFIHIAYLIGFDSKTLVLFQWGWNYITRKRGALLITNG